jgi:hypothetical protein
MKTIQNLLANLTSDRTQASARRAEPRWSSPKSVRTGSPVFENFLLSLAVVGAASDDLRLKLPMTIAAN